MEERKDAACASLQKTVHGEREIADSWSKSFLCGVDNLVIMQECCEESIFSKSLSQSLVTLAIGERNKRLRFTGDKAKFRKLHGKQEVVFVILMM